MMNLTSLRIANAFDPFTLIPIHDLGFDSLILSHGEFTVCVSGTNFLQYIKTEIEDGNGLDDITLHFQDTDQSLELSCEMYALCYVADDNYSVELMELIAMLRKSKNDYTDRLAAIGDEVMSRIQIFVHDLLIFDSERAAHERMEASWGSPYYMSEVYFTSDQVDTILAFKGKNGLPLRNVLEATFDNVGAVCTAFTFVPILQRYFSIPDGFQYDPVHMRAYRAFCRSRRGVG